MEFSENGWRQEGAGQEAAGPKTAVLNTVRRATRCVRRYLIGTQDKYAVDFVAGLQRHTRMGERIEAERRKGKEENGAVSFSLAAACRLATGQLRLGLVPTSLYRVVLPY